MNELYEYLEEIAAFKKNCLLKFKDQNNTVITTHARIIEYYNEDGKTYIRTDAGIRIPLKQIIDVDYQMANRLS